MRSLATYLLSAALLAPLVLGLRCFQCGQYTDGPGSITPCLNYTESLHLKECPPQRSSQCIKYVNYASTVRDCAHECIEKRSDSWGTSIYCCSEDGCNAATSERGGVVVAAVASTAVIWKHFRFPGVASL